jgi:hypothetical protein
MINQYFASNNKNLIEDAVKLLPQLFDHWLVKPHFRITDDTQWPSDQIALVTEFINGDEEKSCELALKDAAFEAYAFIQGYLVGKGIPFNEI